MKPCSKFVIPSQILEEIQQKFPSKLLLFNGKSAGKISAVTSLHQLGPEYERTQIAKPCLFIRILRNSSVSRSLWAGQMAHSCIIRIGFESDLFTANNLLRMYGKCGVISDALQLFDGMLVRDVVSWNTMISGFVASGRPIQGFGFFREMKRVGMHPTQSSFASVLVASNEMGSVENCQQIHGESVKSGSFSDFCIANALMAAYVRLGYVMDARKIFDRMDNFDEVSVEILLSGYVQHKNPIDAFELFRYSSLEGIVLNHVTLSGLISLCANLELIDYGIHMHGHVIKVGMDLNVSIVNSLITMYARSYLLEDALFLFECLRQPDIVTWNSLIGGYAYNGLGDAGVSLVGKLLSGGMRMNESTFSSFLSSCTNVTVLENAKKAHVLILKLREVVDQGTDNIILTMYCRCKSLSYVNTVFKTTESRDFVSYNLLSGLFKEHSLYEDSIRLFCQIQLEGFFNVDEIMYSSVISSCGKLGCLEMGKQIHCSVIKTGFEKVLRLGNSFLGMYSQCGRIDAMERMFSEIDRPDLFSWNLMIMGYAHNRLVDESIRIFQEMKGSGMQLNEFSYCALIDSCNCIETMVIGKQIQAHIYKLGIVCDTALMNSFVTMYANCGMMEKASAVFEEIQFRDSVSWNAMVSGFSQNGFAEESLRFYLLMTKEGLKPNHMTFVCISKSCAMLADLVLGSQFHALVIKRAFESDVSVSNSFITMYSKCGNIHDSSKIFQTIIQKDVITWNSMICGYAYHGCGREALDIFAQMKTSEVKPNDVTFVGVLSSCSHAGLTSEAWIHFNSMSRDHGLTPSEEHYSCMVDILCRAGQLSEAHVLIRSMPFDPPPLIWRTLLSSCRANENVKLGEEAAERIMRLEPKDSAAYVLLSNIYASVMKREDKAEMRRIMKDRGVEKKVGYSWIWS